MTSQINDANKLLHSAFIDNYPAEATRYLEDVSAEEIAAILESQPIDQTLNIWERLSPEIGTSILQSIEEPIAINILNQIDPTKGAALLTGLPEQQRKTYLDKLDKHTAIDLERALSYPPGSAGASMDTQIRFYNPEMTVEEAISRLRSQKRKALRSIFIVDENNRLLGMVDIQQLALSGHETRLRSIYHPVPVSIEAMASSEEMVKEFEKYRITDLAVVDFEGRLLGVVRYHTLIKASKEESSADIQTMVGVSKDERALSKPSFSVRKRLPWLQINLVTAFLAAAVVGIFEDTIAQYTALAILLPVVAGQSGNTGAQALAVTMRGLALREIRIRQWPQMIFKELNVGLWNGIAVALTTALGVYIWSQSAGLCLIIGVSMVLSMVIASVAGTTIPIILSYIGQDPATSSSIILTTVTDVMGFFSFLGIATLLLWML